VAELLTRLLERPPSNPVIDTVFRRSEGIPYFVEELTRSAARGCIDMPDTLRDALNVRVQTLSDEAHQVVELAAVAGNRVDHELLASVAGGSDVDLDRGLREAIDASVLTADETGYSFRHALLREVVHDDLLPGQHARLHARFAALMEAHPELVDASTAPLEIAHHWSAAHEVTKAFTWSITAARSGLAAYHEALKMYERALELWDRVTDPESVAGPRAGVLKEAAKAASNAGEDERALALVNAALAEFGPDSDPEERTTALMLKASLLGGLLKPGTVQPLREAMALLPDDADPVLRARVIESLARQLMLSGRIAEGVSTARDAVAAAVGLGSNKAESHARNTLATGLHAIGEEAEAMAEWERASPLARGSTMTELRYFINYSDALNLTGRYADAVSQAMAGIELARERGLERSVGAMLAGNAAEPLIALGQWSRAYAMTERALELDPPVNHVVHLRLLQAWLRIWRGELDEAEAIIREFRPMITSADPSPQYVSQVIRADAEHAMAVGDHARAWADVTAFLDRWEIYHAAWTYPVLAVGAAAARALDQAEGTDQRSGLIRDFVEQRTLKINIRPLWLPVITAELADSAEGWRTALAELHALLIHGAHHELGRRRASLADISSAEIGDLATQAADDALIAVLSQLDSFRGTSRFTTWAYKFALLEAGVKARRRAWQAREVVLDDRAWTAFRDPGGAAYERPEDAELLGALRAAMASALTPHQREVFSALALDAVPIDVLAERLNTTRAALYEALHDARRKLRAALVEAGHPIDAGRRGR
jgi:RNA polymerase sigma factor (sigma-70 family)